MFHLQKTDDYSDQSLDNLKDFRRIWISVIMAEITHVFIFSFSKVGGFPLCFGGINVVLKSEKPIKELALTCISVIQISHYLVVCSLMCELSLLIGLK